MLNTRKIDKFWLSGGWQHVKFDTEKIAGVGIKAVLDLQFTPADEDGPANAIKMALFELGVEYRHIKIWDGNLGQDIEALFSNAVEILSEFEIRYPDPKQSIMVKCAGGVSRSAAVLSAYYAESRRWTYTEAIDYIRSKEGHRTLNADPNPVFRSVLKRKYGG